MIELERTPSPNFRRVIEHVRNTHETVFSSAFAVLVIQNGRIVSEHYEGYHSQLRGAKAVSEFSQFHIASVRKSYTAFAVAWAVHQRFIHSIDDLVVDYLPELDSKVLRGISLRHLLTHTHGLRTDEFKQLYNHFSAGTGWDYRDENIRMLAEIVQRTTGKTVAQISEEEVFTPMGFTGSGWRVAPHEDMVLTVVNPSGPPSFELRDSPNGDRPNMFATTRELALWGYLHLEQGSVEGEQIIPREVVSWITTIQSPLLDDNQLPRNGFLWQVQGEPASQSEIGLSVPKGSFQMLGMMGQTLLVIPEFDLVAVRMLNRLGNPPGYDYLADVKSFGDVVTECARTGGR